MTEEERVAEGLKQLYEFEYSISPDNPEVRRHLDLVDAAVAVLEGTA